MPGKESRAALLREAIRLKQVQRPGRPLPARPVDQPARLGELQRSLWLLHQLAPDSAAYNVTSAFRVTGALDVSRLEQAFNAVVAKHRILRSTFAAHQDEMWQTVHDLPPLKIERFVADEGSALEAAVREGRRPFDLGTGPLIRLLLVEDATGQERLLALVLHHIVADERSLRLLWEELSAVYEGKRIETGEEPQYDDFVHWSVAETNKQRASELDYWRRRLLPPPEDLVLPFARSGEVTRVGQGRFLVKKLRPELQERVRRMASATGATPYVVFAFVFRLLLHRYTAGQNIAFATPASRRSHAATAKMIGYFLNPTVIHLGVDEKQSVGEVARIFSQEMRELLLHGTVPFDILAEELAPPRQQGRNPIFQTMFVYQETQPPPNLNGVVLEPVRLDLGAPKFELTLFVTEGEQSLEVGLEYRTDRFEEVWMRRLLDHYETLLGHLAEELTQPVAKASMLSVEEEERLRENASGAALEVDSKALLPQQILEAAHSSPDATALICESEEWSYSRLERAARRIADELAKQGMKPGERVGLFLDRSPLMIAGVLGCHWNGAAYVPVDPGYPAARNLAVLEDAEVAAVLTRSTLRDRVPEGSWPVIEVDSLDGAVENSWLLPEIGSKAPAYILYTSGSTGKPKGVVVSHGGLRASNAAREQVYGVPPRRFLLLPSVAFDSSVAGIFWTLAEGGTLVIPTDDQARDPRQLVQLVAEKKVTSLLCIPSLYAHLLAAGAGRLGSLELGIVAGETCRRQLAKEHFRVAPGARLFNEYGPTEATVWSTVDEIRQPNADQPVTIGKPIPGVRVDVLDELGRRVPAGVAGQGFISGPTVAEGYWKRDDLTAERFVTDACDPSGEGRTYCSGDSLMWTEDGRLLFLGRGDEQIKLRGFRIEPGEIEAALLEMPAVEEAAVVARAIGSGSKQLVAFVKGHAPDALGALRKRLPDFMTPSRIVELPVLPYLPNGKVDREKLRELALEAESPIGRRRQILNDREQVLLSLWEGLLGRSGISLNDNFFQLGGHSLLVVAMTTAIERDFGVVIPPAEVFQNPTVRELARRIEQSGGSDAHTYSHLFPLQPGGKKSPFIFSVPHFFSEMVASRFRGERPVYGLRGVSLRHDGNWGRWRTMRDLAEEMVDEVCRRFPDERYVMAGYSFGATMAVEAVRVMEERGLSVRRLYLIAPMALDYYQLGPVRMQVDALRQPLEELTFGQAVRMLVKTNSPLTPKPYERAWRQMVIRPWRQLLCLSGKVRTLAGLPLTPGILHADVRLERFRLHTRYQPGIVKTPTVVFNAREPDTDAAATWRPHFKGPFSVHDIPDPHLNPDSIEAAKKLMREHWSDLEDL